MLDCADLGRLMLQMKERYANEKPYGKWLEAQVATLPDLMQSVPEHLLKVPTIHSRHSPLQASPVALSNGEGSSGVGSNGQGGNGQGADGQGADWQGANGQKANGAGNGSHGTLSSSEEGGQVGLNASNHGAGTCETALRMYKAYNCMQLWLDVKQWDHSSLICYKHYDPGSKVLGYKLLQTVEELYSLAVCNTGNCIASPDARSAVSQQ